MNERFEKEEIRAVIERALRYMAIRGSSGPPGRILVLIPAGACDVGVFLSEYVLSGHAEHAVFCFERTDDIPDGACDAGLTIVSEDRPREAGRIYGDLSGFDRAEIVSPSVSFLKSMAAGTGGRMSSAATYFLLKGLPCIVRSSYQPDSLRPGRFARELKQVYEDLWDMGVSFAGLIPDLPELGERAYDLVTEGDVMNAYDRHVSRIICGPGAVVTPLASEAARERNIQIIIRKEEHSDEYTGK